MSTLARLSIAGALSVLRDVGWVPGAIIDIGVKKGTNGLYTIWPGVPICLVEPSPDNMTHMKKIAAAHPNVHIYNVGASNKTGKMIGRKHTQKTDVALGDAKPKWNSEVTVFPVMTCDDIVADAKLPAPFLYKLDTDTHDREALQGSAETLKRTEVCVVEANIFFGYRGWITPAEIWRLFDSAGFVLIDTVGHSHSDAGVLRYVDLIFAHKDGQAMKLALAHSARTERRQ